MATSPNTGVRFGMTVSSTQGQQSTPFHRPSDKSGYSKRHGHHHHHHHRRQHHDQSRDNHDDDGDDDDDVLVDDETRHAFDDDVAPDEATVYVSVRSQEDVDDEMCFGVPSASDRYCFICHGLNKVKSEELDSRAVGLYGIIPDGLSQGKSNRMICVAIQQYYREMILEPAQRYDHAPTEPPIVAAPIPAPAAAAAATAAPPPLLFSPVVCNVIREWSLRSINHHFFENVHDPDAGLNRLARYSFRALEYFQKKLYITTEDKIRPDGTAAIEDLHEFNGFTYNQYDKAMGRAIVIQRLLMDRAAYSITAPVTLNNQSAQLMATGPSAKVVKRKPSKRVDPGPPKLSPQAPPIISDKAQAANLPAYAFFC